MRYLGVWIALLLCAFLAPLLGSPSLFQKRLSSEFRELLADGLTLDRPFNDSRQECGIRLSPLRGNMLEWHFSFQGAEKSPYEGGIFHGRVLLDKDYPRKAPIVSMKTPSGRWKTDTPICLSASSHHPELWDSSWNLRTLVLSLRAFMTTNPGEIGSLPRNVTLQKELAAASIEYICPHCNVHHSALLPGTEDELHAKTERLAQSKLMFRTDREGGKSIRRENGKSNKMYTGRPGRARPNEIRSTPKVLGKTHQFMRKMVLYSGSLLLLGLWKLCVDLIERAFIQGTGMHNPDRKLW